MATALAVDVRQWTGLAESGAARAAWRNRDAGGQLRELDELPPIQRQLPDLTIVDGRGEFGVRRRQQGYLRGDGDRVGDLTELQRDGNVDLLAGAQRDSALDEVLEAGELDAERVLSDRQGRQEEPSPLVGDPLEPGIHGAVRPRRRSRPGAGRPAHLSRGPQFHPVLGCASLTRAANRMRQNATILKRRAERMRMTPIDESTGGS